MVSGSEHRRDRSIGATEVTGTCPYAGKASVGNGASVDLALGWDVP